VATQDIQEDKAQDKQQQLALELAQVGVCEYALPPTPWVRVNEVWAAILGYAPVEIPPAEVFLSWWGQQIHPADHQRVIASFNQLYSGKVKKLVCSFRLRHRDGSWCEVEVVAVTLRRDNKGWAQHVFSVMRINQQKMHELKLKMLSSAIEHSNSMVMITNLHGDIEYANPEFSKITGYEKSEISKLNSRVLRADDADMQMISDMWATISAGGDWHGELRNKKKNGDYYWALISISPITDEYGRVSHYVSVSEDVTAQKETQFKMEQLAYVDSLTGLANRILLRDRLEQGLKTVQRNGSHMALLYIDLDQFKRINDSLGHDVGDALLMQVADRLRHCVRHQDTVARMGGDEFVILLADVDSMASVSAVARKILGSMREPHKLLRHEIIVTPSIGITIAPEDSLNADILLKNGDLAMYRAKSLGRNNYQFFTEEMNSRVLDQLMMENELRQAIGNEEIQLVFQPQMELKTGRLVGVETLVRWQHPEKGLLGPDDFIPVAEETGLIVELGEWVLINACRQWRNLQQPGRAPIKLAVNLSARQFRDPDLLDMIQRALSITGFQPINLELEITETILMEYLDHAIDVLQKIKALGIAVSIDDFGTGYSSLNYLKRLPLDALKIDKSFIADIPNNQDDMAIAAAVIAMAHKLKLKVVAEGVETAAQWTFLKKNRCDIAQGYLLGKPMTADTFFRNAK
jgi:diguanylate cyclase (GGDEF)-like protein/PAS domain S-box-containing protein